MSAVTTTTHPDPRAWQRVGLVLFAVGWGANHFASLLLVYRERLSLDAAAPGLLLGMYALGLVPGLLLAGPLSDRRGRRAVVLPSAAVALAASVVLGAFGDDFAALLVGRLVYGLGAGGVMSAGAVWVIELSRDAPAGAGPRRATIAMSSGFGLGPLITGLLAQYAPAPIVLPYAVHVVLLGTVLVLARGAPEPSDASDPNGPNGPREPGEPRLRRPAAASGPLIRIQLDRAGWRRFARAVAPMAPFVFAFPTIGFAVLPSMLGGSLGHAPAAYTGLLCALTLTAGVLAQPITRRFEPAIAARLGLVTGATGIALGLVAVASQTPALLLVVAPILGTAYGVCMTAGLFAVQRMAPPDARGGITGLYYVLTYVGFAAPYLLALATHRVAPTVALGITTGFMLITAAILPRR